MTVPAQNNSVTITRELYDDLTKDSLELQALYDAGVDNWPGYEIAIASLEGNDDD